MENNNNGHNQNANSSEQESSYHFGLQLKYLSNALKSVGQEMQICSELLKNTPPHLNTRLQQAQVKLKNPRI